VQLFLDNVPSTKLTLNEFGSCTVIANWQPYVTEERQPSPTDEAECQSETDDNSPGTDVTVQHDVAVQNNGDAVHTHTHTLPDPTDHSAPLRFADAVAPLLLTALFSFMFVPLLSLIFVTLP